MFAPGLAMLWEDTEPTSALRERFGLRDLEQAARWVTTALDQVWGLSGGGVERILISDTNFLAWVHTDDGAYVIKVSAREPDFPRLDAIAALLGDLEDQQLPVAAPLAARDGRRRSLVPSDRHLSVMVMPRIEGDLLEVTDLVAVAATGEMVGRLHTALVDVDPEPFRNGPREFSGDLRAQMAGSLDRLPGARAPRAAARLTNLLESLPDLDVPPQLGHGDVRGANVLVRDQQVAAILDFDEMSIRHRTAEISLGAVLLATEFRRWPPAPAESQRAFLTGYRSVVALTDAEHAWSEALALWFGLSQIPAGEDPAGWATAVEASA